MTREPMADITATSILTRLAEIEDALEDMTRERRELRARLYHAGRELPPTRQQQEWDEMRRRDMATRTLPLPAGRPWDGM